MIWFAMALMTGAVVLALVWPLAGHRAVRSGRTADVGFYADLLAEVEGDIASGLIAPGEAKTARAEVGRRLIAASRAGAEAGPAPGLVRRRLAAMGAACVLVPLLSLGLYLRIGHPAQPDEPFDARIAAPGDLSAAVAKIEAHLTAHPEDGRGFEVVAPVYLRMGRYDDAVRAYRAVIADLGDGAARESALGQAIVMAADGVVTSEARGVFEKAVALDPRLPQARFFVALAAEQDGDKAKAATLWQALLADSSADAPWRPTIEQHLVALGAKPSAASSAAPQGMPSGPAASAIAALPDQQRQAAIRSMVEGLAGRLAEDGHDVEGWLRLIKAYNVLGERERAKTAVHDARVGLAGDTAVLARIDALARELGLEG